MKKRKILTRIISLTCFICFAFTPFTVKAENFETFEDLEQLVENISENPEIFYTTNFENIEFKDGISFIAVTLKCAEGNLVAVFDQYFNIVQTDRYENKVAYSTLKPDWVILIFFLIAFAFIVAVIEVTRKEPNEN